MIRCSRRNSLLLEVLISFAIVALCILPLLYPNIFILQSQKKMIQTVELDHIVNLVYADTLEKLYLNEIPWDTIKDSKKIPIDADAIKNCGFGCPSPYTGSLKFVEMKHKPKKPVDAALYLFKIVFEFTRKDDKKNKEKKEYQYQILIKKKV